MLRTLAATAAIVAAGVLALSLMPANAGLIKPTTLELLPAPKPRLDHPLSNVIARLAAGQPLKIVALGSSSTEGVGASSPDRSYPARLRAILRARYPNIDITVRNEGVRGEDAQEMLARLDQVIAQKADLIIWQVGTNAVLENLDLSEQARLIQAGLDRLKLIDADIVLVDPQYTPDVISKPNAVRMVRLIETLARQNDIGVFHRFAVMRDWRKVRHIPFKVFTSDDGLHMNDWSYDRFAKLLADAINEASPLPVHTVRARAPSKTHS